MPTSSAKERPVHVNKSSTANTCTSSECLVNSEMTSGARNAELLTLQHYRRLLLKQELRIHFARPEVVQALKSIRERFEEDDDDVDLFAMSSSTPRPITYWDDHVLRQTIRNELSRDTYGVLSIPIWARILQCTVPDGGCWTVTIPAFDPIQEPQKIDDMNSRFVGQPLPDILVEHVNPLVEEGVPANRAFLAVVCRRGHWNGTEEQEPTEALMARLSDVLQHLTKHDKRPAYGALVIRRHITFKEWD